MEEINPQSAAYIMARIETKLDTVIANHEAHKVEDVGRFEAINMRVKSLEMAKAVGYGALIVIGLLFSDKLMALANAIK